MKKAFKLPEFDGDEPLIYHRLTAISGDRADVLRAVEAGAILTPFDDRADAEMSGLDPIDIAAGDGSAVFLAPGRPFSLTTSKPHLRRTPGVAFRLSTLLSIADVSIRPTDLQTYYFRAVQAGDFDVSWHNMLRTVEDVYDQIAYLQPLSEILNIIRSNIEVAASRENVLDVMLNTADHLNRFRDDVRMPNALTQAISVAAESATAFIEAFYDEDALETSVLTGATLNLIEETEQAILDGNETWADKAVSSNAEVLLWGQLPLSAAVLMFDANGFTALRQSRTSLNGFILPA